MATLEEILNKRNPVLTGALGQEQEVSPIEPLPQPRNILPGFTLGESVAPGLPVSVPGAVTGQEAGIVLPPTTRETLIPPSTQPAPVVQQQAPTGRTGQFGPGGRYTYAVDASGNAVGPVLADTGPVSPPILAAPGSVEEAARGKGFTFQQTPQYI